ncbi:MAG: STAS domain-containing protein [Solirubrobacterales bacterium]
MAETKEGSREVRDGMLTLRVSIDAQVQTLALAGELDMANAATLSSELEAIESDAGSEPITIDLRELEFIDSTGIAVLVAAYRRARAEGESRLRFIRSKATGVQRVMDVTGLEKELPFVA